MRILNKLKVQFKRFMTGKSGFSLVELIVVIAIMAVMAAVLAPALIGYVEKSRAQKDYSTMGEVVESATLALSTQSVYDEVLDHSVYDNVSCYVDKNNEAEFSSFKVKLKDAMGSRKEQYMFNDEARKLDETVYFAAGNMRGLTVTLSPSSDESGKRVYVLKNGIINKFVGRKTGYLSENPELYNAIRSVVGDKVVGSSQTYRNSDYTLFIRIGTTGGKQEEKQDAVQVWGQFNGTNLTQTDHEYRLAAGRDVGSDGANDEINNANKNNSQEPSDFSENYEQLNLSGTIPEGGKYTVYKTKAVLKAGDKFPDKSESRDTFTYGDYEYKYNQSKYGFLGGGWDTASSKQKGWGVGVKDKSKTEYGPILHSINGVDIVSVNTTFWRCSKLITAPDLPPRIISANGTFSGCSSLKTAPKLPDKIQTRELYSYNGVSGMFSECLSLVTYKGSSDPDGDFSNYKIPNSIKDCSEMFSNCKKITKAPSLHEGITNVSTMFFACEQLTTAPKLPSSVEKVSSLFNNCENLKTYHGSNDADYDFSNYYIPPKVTSLRALFKQCIKIKSGPKIPEGITDTASMFYNCKELLSAPSVPENVKNIEEMFLECNKLTSVTINCNPTTWTKALYSSKITTVNGNTTMKNDILLTKTSYAQNPTA